MTDTTAVCLLAFARLPVPGKVKTRLAAACGPQAACDFYSTSLLHCLQEAQKTGYAVCCCCSEEAEVPPMRDWLLSRGLDLRVTSQISEPDLGARMLAAATAALNRGASKVIIFGTDVPGLKTDVFQAAAELLDSHDLVFGPARDGGYYMVGMKHPHTAIFQSVEWSTATVLSTTIAIAKRHQLTVPDPLRLPQLIDIDVVKDLQTWMEDSSAEAQTTATWRAACDAIQKAGLG